MTVRGVLRLIGLATSLVLLAAAPRGAAAQEPIRFGAPLALTGPVSSFGTQDKRALDIAIEEINKAGGVNGRPLEPIYVDTGGKPDSARSTVERLSQRPKHDFRPHGTRSTSVTWCWPKRMGPCRGGGRLCRSRNEAIRSRSNGAIISSCRRSRAAATR
jgi:substrate-binding family protein